MKNIDPNYSALRHLTVLVFPKIINVTIVLGIDIIQSVVRIRNYWMEKRFSRLIRKAVF